MYIADTFGFNIKLETLAGGNFGPVNVGATAGPIYAMFQFTGGAASAEVALSGFTIGTQGNAHLDYTNAGSTSCVTGARYHPGDFCAVSINFTTIAGPSPGPPQPTPSLKNSPHYVNVFLGQYTSGLVQIANALTRGRGDQTPAHSHNHPVGPAAIAGAAGTKFFFSNILRAGQLVKV